MSHEILCDSAALYVTHVTPLLWVIFLLFSYTLLIEIQFQVGSNVEVIQM